MTQTDKQKRVRPGIPCSEEELKESEKCWKDIEDSIANVYKTKGGKKCVNSSSTRKKPLKK